MTDPWLVSTAWLAGRLGDPSVRILDVTGALDESRRNVARPEYEAGHIPGAVWFDIASADGELSDPSSTLDWTWPPMARIEAAMGRVGVDADTTVVICARSLDRPLGHGTMWCTRAWWTLHHSGVRCAILEGGWERWVAERRPVETGDVIVDPRSFTGTDRRGDAIADRHDVEAALAETTACVIDALPESSFDGTRVVYARPGHITGASNIPYRNFVVEPTAVFVPVGDARAIFAAHGVLDRERAVLY